MLDVGCGTGVLSLFAARAGARKVYAVDGSAEIAEVARDNVERNGFAGAVEVIQGRMEGVSLPEKVDVIVSEWMGYCLLYESMLQSVLHARDRFLKPGGAVLPDIATMWVAGIAPEALGLNFWRDVHGLDMSAVAEREERRSRGRSIARGCGVLLRAGGFDLTPSDRVSSGARGALSVSRGRDSPITRSSSMCKSFAPAVVPALQVKGRPRCQRSASVLLWLRRRFRCARLRGPDEGEIR